MSKIHLKHPNATFMCWFPTAWLCCVGVIGTLIINPAQGNNRQAQEAQISALLDKAEEAISKNRLTTPPYDNAMSYIEQVLSLEPNHPHAKRLLDRIVQGYAVLVNDTTKRASSAAQYLQSAIRFRERAYKVALSHHLSMAPIERMDELIALSQRSLESMHRRKSQSSANTLLNSHLQIARQALMVHNFDESTWHAQRARSLVSRYRLDETGVVALERQITARRGDQPMIIESQDSSKNQDTHARRQLLAELSSCHIETALAYLDLGKLNDALRHQGTAHNLITQYGLDESELLKLTQRIDQQRIALTLPSHRLFGNF